VIEFTWVISSFIHALIKHEDFINYALISQFSSIIWSFPTSFQNSYPTIHISLPYLFYHNILRNPKLLTNTYQLFVLFDCVCIIVYVMLFCAIVGVKNYVLSREKWKDHILQKASDTHSYTYFYYALLIFSSMHDRWIFKCL
jgi:hypothetical protein